MRLEILNELLRGIRTLYRIFHLTTVANFWLPVLQIWPLNYGIFRALNASEPCTVRNRGWCFDIDFSHGIPELRILFSHRVQVPFIKFLIVCVVEGLYDVDSPWISHSWELFLLWCFKYLLVVYIKCENCFHQYFLIRKTARTSICFWENEVVSRVFLFVFF